MPLTLADHVIEPDRLLARARERIRHIEREIIPSSQNRINDSVRRLSTCIEIEVDMCVGCEHEEYRRR